MPGSGRRVSENVLSRRMSCSTFGRRLRAALLLPSRGLPLHVPSGGNVGTVTLETHGGLQGIDASAVIPRSENLEKPDEVCPIRRNSAGRRVDFPAASDLPLRLKQFLD